MFIPKAIFLACLAIILLTITPTLHAQKADVSLLAGAAKIPDSDLPTFPSILGPPLLTTQKSTASFAWQANFGWRFFHTGPVSMLLELPFTMVPSQHPQVLRGIVAGTANSGALVAGGQKPTYMFTPGVRFRFFDSRVSPYAALGAGIERSTLVRGTTDGLVIAAFPSRAYKGTFDFGGGADIKLTKLIALRAEVRDFVRTGHAISESRQDLLFMGGFALHF